MRLALFALAVALVLPSLASAHVTIAPPFVEAGVPTEITMTVPNERPPHATVALEATMPPGVSIVSTTAPEGWAAAVDGSTVAWSGGRIADRAAVVFSVRVQADVSAGTYRVAARQRYDDGADVRWTSDLAVLPASGEASPGERPWPALVAAIIGVAVIAVSLPLLRRLRR